MRWLPLVVAASLAACANPKNPVAPHKPGDAPISVVATVAALTGKVKLISEHGAGVISNNSGNLISNNGGSLISDAAGSLTGKTKYALAAEKPGEALLADALVELVDAAGKPVLDAAGKPLTATTDATGTYRFASVPGKNAVLRIKLHEGGLLKGGELSALKTPAVTTLAIDTSSALGAAYVLGKYVQGQQQALDKLPTAEAQRLHDELEAARPLLGRVPGYAPADLVAATEELRGKAPSVAESLEAIRALLLGQANLGAGRQATRVAIFDPSGVLPLPDGSLLVAERGAGRIRRVGADGAIATYADVVRGEVKQNFKQAQDLARLADGSLLVATNATIFKLSPAGAVTVFAGSDGAKPGAVDVPAVSTPLRPRRLAVAGDGTVYVGEDDWPDSDVPGRLLAITPDGVLHRVPLDVGTALGAVVGVAAGPDGEVFALWKPAGEPAGLYRYQAGEGTQAVAEHLAQSHLGAPDLARGADGTLYVSDPGQRRVVAIAPDRTQRVIAGSGAPVGADLVAPAGLAVDAAGTLFCCDFATNLVHALTPDGRWSIRAGLDPSLPIDPSALPLNGPATCVFDAAGALYITEAASHSVRRFANGQLTTVAGGTAGFKGDGGPAADAKLNLPSALALRGKELLVTDGGNHRLRAIAEDGTIRTVVGAADGKRRFAPGERVPADQVEVDGNGLAVDARGRIYWSTLDNQVLRLATDNMVELVCGPHHPDSTGTPGAPSLAQLLGPPDSGPAATTFVSDPQGLAFTAQGNLLVTDTVGGKVLQLTGLDGNDAQLATLAGRATAAWLGELTDGAPLPVDTDARQAVIAMPLSLAVDAAGNIYVGEAGTTAIPLVASLEGGLREGVTAYLPKTFARIRKITPDGHISVVAGPGGRFFTDPTDEDGLVLPGGLAIAPDGRLAILDIGANLVRILPAGSF